MRLRLRFEISRDVLAAAGEIAEKLGEARPPCEEGVGQLEHLLEIAVPRGEPRLGIEHDDAVAHVVEGDAQLGLAIPQLVEEPCILYRDHRLVGEGGGQLNLLIRKWSDMCAEKTEKTDLRVAAQQRHGQNGSISPDTPPLRQGVFGIRHHVGDVNGTPLGGRPCNRSAAASPGQRVAGKPFFELGRCTVKSHDVITIVLTPEHLRLVGAAQPRGGFDQCAEHCL